MVSHRCFGQLALISGPPQQAGCCSSCCALVVVVVVVAVCCCWLLLLLLLLSLLLLLLLLLLSLLLLLVVVLCASVPDGEKVSLSVILSPIGTYIFPDRRWDMKGPRLNNSSPSNRYLFFVGQSSSSKCIYNIPGIYIYYIYTRHLVIELPIKSAEEGCGVTQLQL